MFISKYASQNIHLKMFISKFLSQTTHLKLHILDHSQLSFSASLPNSPASLFSFTHHFLSITSLDISKWTDPVGQVVSGSSSPVTEC